MGFDTTLAEAIAVRALQSFNEPEDWLDSFESTSPHGICVLRPPVAVASSR
jgi:hypothetical protein